MLDETNKSKNMYNNIEFSFLNNLDKFLYKFIILNIISNSLLYFISNEILAAITYSLTVLYFFFNFKKIYSHNFIALFAQCFVVFLINLTYLTFIFTLIINNLIFNTSLEEMMRFYFYCNLDTYFLANIYLLFFSLSILLFNNFIPKSLKITIINKINLTNNLFNKKKIIILILLCIAFEFFFYFSNLLGTQQSGGFLVGESTWYTQFYKLVVIFHLFLNILFLSSHVQDKISLNHKFLLLISFILNLFFFGFYVRRLIVIFFLTSFFLYFLITKKKIFNFKNILIYIISIFIIIQFFIFLGNIRASYSVAKTDSLRSTIAKGEIFSFFKDSEINKYGKKIFIENLRFRAFYNHELATLFYYNGLKKENSLNGKMLFVSLIRMIPEVIYPNKKDYVAGEPLIKSITDSPLYNLDTVDSLHSYSFADFGLFGLIIYPIIINLIFFIIYKIMSLKKIHNYSSIFIIAIICPLITLMSLEVTLIRWFIDMRNILIFILFFNFLISFILQDKDVKNEN